MVKSNTMTVVDGTAAGFPAVINGFIVVVVTGKIPTAVVVRVALYAYIQGEEAGLGFGHVAFMV